VRKEGQGELSLARPAEGDWAHKLKRGKENCNISGAHSGEEAGVLLLNRGETGKRGYVGSERDFRSGSGSGSRNGLGVTLVVGIVGENLGVKGSSGVEHCAGELAVGIGKKIVQEVEIVRAFGWLGAEVVDCFDHAGIGRAEVVKVSHGERKTIKEFAGKCVVNAILNERGHDVDERGLNLFGSLEVAELDAGRVMSVVETAATFADGGFVMVVAVGASAKSGRATDKTVGLDVMAATDHRTSMSK
jgi:hypothetical protein